MLRIHQYTTYGNDWSNEKNLGWLDYIGDYTTELLHRDYKL